MNKVIIYTLLGLFGLLVIYVVIYVGVIVFGTVLDSSNPMRQSDDQIRKSILELTPIGTSKEDVLKVIENNQKWSDREDFDYGYLIQDGYSMIYYRDLSYNKNDVVGVKTIRVHIGDSSEGIFKARVYAYWAFDENSKLVDIDVGKESEGL